VLDLVGVACPAVDGSEGSSQSCLAVSFRRAPRRASTLYTLIQNASRWLTDGHRSAGASARAMASDLTVLDERRGTERLPTPRSDARSRPPLRASTREQSTPTRSSTRVPAPKREETRLPRRGQLAVVAASTRHAVERGDRKQAANDDRCR
jgi:hypothetical protein